MLPSLNICVFPVCDGEKKMRVRKKEWKRDRVEEWMIELPCSRLKVSSFDLIGCHSQRRRCRPTSSGKATPPFKLITFSIWLSPGFSTGRAALIALVEGEDGFAPVIEWFVQARPHSLTSLLWVHAGCVPTPPDVCKIELSERYQSCLEA